MAQARSHQVQLNLEDVFNSLQLPLALVTDQRLREEIEHFLSAARPHQERALVDVLSDIAATINEAATETQVRVEYRSRQLYLTVESKAGEEDTADPLVRMDGELDKVTIRLPAPLKQSIDEAANARGVSLNSWYVRALARAVERQRTRRGQQPDTLESRPGRRGRRGHGGRRSAD